MDDITFTTAFFNIRSIETTKDIHDISTNEHYVSPLDYFMYAKELLSFPVNLIIYTTPDLVDRFIELRRDYPNKTRIHPVELEDLPYYIYLDQLKNNYISNKVRNVDPIKFTPLYCMIINSKIHFVNLSIDMNPFNTKYFSWIDMRALCLSPITKDEFMSIHKHITNDKLRITCMSYAHNSEVKDRKVYYQYTRGKIAATFWIGSSDICRKFIDLCDQEFISAVTNGICPSEEQVYGVISALNKDLFNFYYGDYNSVLTNYPYIKHHEHLPIHSFYKALYHMDITSATHIFITLWNSYKLGYIEIPKKKDLFSEAIRCCPIPPDILLEVKMELDANITTFAPLLIRDKKECYDITSYMSDIDIIRKLENMGYSNFKLTDELREFVILYDYLLTHTNKGGLFVKLSDGYKLDTKFTPDYKRVTYQVVGGKRGVTTKYYSIPTALLDKFINYIPQIIKSMIEQSADPELIIFYCFSNDEINYVSNMNIIKE